MDLGFITFLVVASGAFFVLWALDLYLGSKFHVKRLMLKRTKDH
jgi:hypothetical protein